MVRVDPGDALFVAPDRAVGFANRPLGMDARGDGVLEHDDARDGKDVVRLERVEQRGDVRDARAARVLGEFRVLSFVIEPEFVLHVDDERVDLRFVGGGDQLGHASLALRRPAIDVERAHDRRRGVSGVERAGAFAHGARGGCRSRAVGVVGTIRMFGGGGAAGECGDANRGGDGNADEQRRATHVDVRVA